MKNNLIDFIELSGKKLNQTERNLLELLDSHVAPTCFLLGRGVTRGRQKASHIMNTRRKLDHGNDHVIFIGEDN